MAFSEQTVFHRYLEADNLTPCAGTVEFTLSVEMTNGGVTLMAGTGVTAQLDASGNVSQSLVSTQDPTTQTQGTPVWRCDERIVGSPVNPWFFVLPPGPGTVDLGTLMPNYNPLNPNSPEAG